MKNSVIHTDLGEGEAREFILMETCLKNNLILPVYVFSLTQGI